MPRANNKGSAVAVEANRKAALAIALRTAGATYERIADEVGYGSMQSAHRAVQRSLMRTIKEPATELRIVELKRYEELNNVLWPKCLEGDLGCVDRWIKLSERRAKLMGLDKLAEGWMSPQDTSTALQIMSAIMTKYVPEEKRSAMLAEVGAVLKMGRTKTIEVAQSGDTSAE